MHRRPEPEPEPELQPSDRERVALQLRLLATARSRLPQDPFPHYLGHVRFIRRGDITDVLLTAGARPSSSGTTKNGIAIADWLDSAFAAMFFAGVEGRRYGQAREASTRGTVLERNVIGFRERELAVVVAPDRVLSLGEAGGWQRSERMAVALRPRSREAKRQAPSLIDVHLDPSQKSVVELPGERSVLILGEAGHGKTTVALHRLAALVRKAPRGFRAAVIVPSEGLRRLIEPVMQSLGVKVEVRVYERWALRQARRAFPELPSRESQAMTASVLRIKRDPALRVALAVLARRRPGRIDDDRDTGRASGKAWATRGDLQHLFGDRKLMEQVAQASREPLGRHVIPELLEHTRVQFSRPSELEYAHVDRARLRTLDGRSIDAGTPLEDAGSIDAEDCAVLFELDRLRAERRGKPASLPRAYDCIMLDEAQELSPLELRLIGRSLAPGGSLIVAGDADQQTDPAAFFGGWEQSMAELARPDHERVVLAVSYRCPPAVVSVARRLVSAPGGADPTSSGSSISTTPAKAPLDEGSRFVPFINECHLAAWLTGELSEIGKRDARASVAVICRTPATARRLVRALRHALDARLVLDGKFVYHSGVNVTTVDQVKGLEFDYVIVPDASPANYPNQPSSRRALYVAVTRARHQLVLGAVAGRTDLLLE